MTLNEKLEKWINNVPFVKMADIKVKIEGNSVSIKGSEEKVKLDTECFNKIFAMINGARWFHEFKANEKRKKI